MFTAVSIEFPCVEHRRGIPAPRKIALPHHSLEDEAPPPPTGPQAQREGWPVQDPRANRARARLPAPAESAAVPARTPPRPPRGILVFETEQL